MWVTTFTNNVVRLKLNGTNAGTFPVGNQPLGIAFDGANIWVGNTNSNNVTKLRASDGANLGTFSTQGDPYGIAFDGVNIWVALSATGGYNILRPSDGKILGFIGPYQEAGPTGLSFDGANMWGANGLGENLSKL